MISASPKDGTPTTVATTGRLHSRPMSNNKEVEWDGDTWFFASADSSQVQEITRNPNVNLGYSRPDKIIVVMEHVAKDGSPKFIPACTLPLTGRNVVDMVITDLAVFQRPDHSSPFRLIEMAPGVTAEDIAAKTTAHYLA